MSAHVRHPRSTRADGGRARGSQTGVATSGANSEGELHESAPAERSSRRMQTHFVNGGCVVQVVLGG